MEREPERESFLLTTHPPLLVDRDEGQGEAIGGTTGWGWGVVAETSPECTVEAELRSRARPLL